MQSPLRGLERLTEELRLERQKASTALQDRARLRVEIESLKQSNEQKEEELRVAQDSYVLAQTDIGYLSADLAQLRADFQVVSEDLVAQNEHHGVLYNDKMALQMEVDVLRESLMGHETRIAGMRIRTESLETQRAGKDELLAQVRREMQELRAAHKGVEGEKLALFAALVEARGGSEALRAQLDAAEGQQTSMADIYASNDKLRAELEACLEARAAQMEQSRDLSRRVSETDARAGQLEDDLGRMRAEGAALAEQLTEGEASREQLLARLQAEEDACRAVGERLAAAARGRDFLDEQLGEEREVHARDLAASAALELALGESRARGAQLQGELDAAECRLSECVAVPGAPMTMELDLLRGQLNDVRRQLIRRDVEEQAGVLPPAAVIEREQASRLVYEGIIHELRAELERANASYHTTARRCEDLMRRAAQAEQLEEEVRLYQEMARHSSTENQSTALSVSQATERTAKFAHETQSLAHALHRSEAELTASRAEVLAVQEGLAAQRERVKVLHGAKMGADKRAAELCAANSRLEAGAEDGRQMLDRAVLETERVKRALGVVQLALVDATLKGGEADSLRGELKAQGGRQVVQRGVWGELERDLTLQVETLRHHKASLQRELEGCKEKAASQAAVLQAAQGGLARARGEMEGVVGERDRLRRELQAQEAAVADGRLQDLRRDLQQTVGEWQDLEREKGTKDRLVAQLRAEGAKERERAALQSMRVGLLEEKLRVAAQELAVFRGIDVYHATMRAELTVRRGRGERDGGGGGGDLGGDGGNERDGDGGNPEGDSEDGTKHLGRFSLQEIMGGDFMSIVDDEDPVPGHKMGESKSNTGVVGPFSRSASASASASAYGASPGTGLGTSMGLGGTGTGTGTGTGVTEAERLELQQRRAERKAQREQQLRNRLLRDGTLSSLSSGLSMGLLMGPRKALSMSMPMPTPIPMSTPTPASIPIDA
ncbi:hypothetical protein B484DRAFT_398440 [Ochromonadaceae sp. CCMP2298]|nr:hypothetical protein B484DRAFT_398440 [Ochromonadaceae sp. CCMP2298]